MNGGDDADMAGDAPGRGPPAFQVGGPFLWSRVSDYS